MKNIRSPETSRGKYDDLIAWLKRLTNKLEEWSKHRKAPGAVAVMLQFDEHSVTANTVSAFLWGSASERDKERSMHWIHVTEAWMELSHDMEGWHPIQPDQMKDHLENIRAAIRWFEQNNVTEDFGIKY